MAQHIRIDASGIHNVPLISDLSSAVPRWYIDAEINDISGVNNINGDNRMILPDGYVDISGTDYDLCGNEVVRTVYQYTRNHAFIGYPNLPVLDGSAVNHAGDPSHNIQGISNELFHLDVSGDCYVSHKIVVGPSGGFFIESISGNTHTIGSGELGDMEITSSNHVAMHVPGQQNALYVASSGGVAIGHNQPREKLDIDGALIVSTPNSMLSANDGTIMYSATDGFLGRKSNIWVPLDNSGGGSGGPSFDASFNYFFMDAPLAPTDGSSVLIQQGSPYLHFSWHNPIQYRCAFNYVGSQPGPPDVSNNDDYNALPYFKGIRIQYRTFDASGTWSPPGWLDVPQTTVSGLWGGKDFLPREIENCYLDTSGSPASYLGGSINSTHTDYSGSVIPLGNTVQIRVAMVNGARGHGVLADPSYNQHGVPSLNDSSWNWLYIPDGSGIPVGSYGPAPPPMTLILPSELPDLLYHQFCLEGRCDYPTPAAPIADTSFNTPFPLSSTTLRVQYRYDISGIRDPSSLQVGGSFADISFPNIRTPPDASGPDPITGTTNYWGCVIQGANPSHKYKIPRYQMRNNVPDFSNNWVDASGQADASLNHYFTTPNPARYEATGAGSGSSYRNFLQTGTINMSVNDLSASTPTVPSSAKQGQSGNQINNIYFLDRGDITSFKMDTNPIRCAANGDGNIGLDASANEVMYFKADISHTIFDVSSEIFKGWTQDPSSVAQTINRNHISFTTSDLSDAYRLQQPTPHLSYNAQGGFYLGIDISNVDVSNINLVDFPDISNNNPAYDPYTLHLYQMVRDASNSPTYQPSGPKTHEFKIGEKPNFDISYNHYKTSVNLGSLPLPVIPPDFFGLHNIGSVTVFGITSTDISLNSIYTTWAPTNDANLTNLEIIFSPNGTNVPWDLDVVSWTYPLTATRSIPNRSLDLPNTQFISYPYSRVHHDNPQFDVSGIYDNNIFRPNPITSTLAGGRPFPITDISFAGLPLWWDQTYSFTPSITGLYNPGVGEYPINYGTSFGSYNLLYNNSDSIVHNQLMWCNGGFTSGHLPASVAVDTSSNPYIDYSGNYYTQTQNYSSFDSSGNLKNLTYTATNDDYWDGGTVDISGIYKWLMIKGQNVTSGNFAQVDITGTVNGGTSLSLVLGTHYLLYVQEIDSYFDPANNTLPSGYTAGRSGWKAVQGTWDQGATVQLNNANEAGCYRRRTNTGQTAVYHIKLYSPNNNVPIFFRIGLKNGSGTSSVPDVKITGVTISYGTN